MKITTVRTLTYGIQIARKNVPTNALMIGDTMMILGNTRLLTNQSMFHVVNFHSIKELEERQSLLLRLPNKIRNIMHKFLFTDDEDKQKN